jgi:RHS repeat-associated protein
VVNNQRVAMRRGSTLKYLHSDHPLAVLRASLGSTVLSTLSSNGFEVGQGYYGYGQYRSGGSLPTDHRYTGQKLDTASGLMYYGARYYDRTVGLFVSPDTLVPDPTNVWDYNRFAYARLNPLKYNDPSGHCASSSALGEEPVPTGGSQECWGYVDHILKLWEQDQSGYWDERWGSQAIFRKWVAATASNDTAFMANEITLYWNSETYQQWEQQQPAVTNPGYTDDPMCGGDPACQAVVGIVNQVDETCQEIDCVAVGNDVVGVGSALLVVGSPLCGPAAPGCAAAGGYIGGGSTLLGTGWTIYSYSQGAATNADLAVTLPLAAKAVTTKEPHISATVAILQVIWDAFLSPDDRW